VRTASQLHTSPEVLLTSNQPAPHQPPWALHLGPVLLASRLPQVLLVLAGGVVGDRLPRRRVMLASDLARCATQATTAVLLATGTARLWQLLVLQAAHGPQPRSSFDPAATGWCPRPSAQAGCNRPMP
jgi:MFS family permease